MKYETFEDLFNSEKVEIWQDNYVNYKGKIKEINDFVQNVKIIVGNNLIQNKKEEENNNSSSLKIIQENNEIIEINLEINNDKKKLIIEKIKMFFESMDREINKIHTFYSIKERKIYQEISQKINNKNKLKNKKIKEIITKIDSLNYYSNFCNQLIIYIYWNIKAIKSLLNIFDNSTKTIAKKLSYLYLKYHLSKTNGNLLYILDFNTLDKALVNIEILLKEYEEIINTNLDFQKDKKNEVQKEIQEFKRNIKENIKSYNSIYSKIFHELQEWQTYLNIYLKLPNSSQNSLFRSTSFTADFMPSKKEKMKYDKNSIVNDIQKMENFDIDETRILENYKLDSNELFKDNSNYIRSYSFSDKTNKILSPENNKNLRIIYFYIFFYTYSYCMIISFLNERITNGGSIQGNNKANNYYPLFGIIISLPILGNLISLLYINKLIKHNFKGSLLLALLFFMVYYLLITLGIIFFIKKEYKTTFVLIIIGRFLLGLSSINLIGKEYINIYIPSQIQIRCNQNYLIFTYFGYIISFLLIGIQNVVIKDEAKKYYYIFTCIIILNNFIVCYIGYLTLHNFNNTKYKDFKVLRTSFLEEIKSRDNNNFKGLELKEKEIINKQEEYFRNANKLNKLTGENILNENLNNNEKYKEYLNKIFICLIFLLCTSQYTSENCLIILPIINKQEVYADDFKIGLFCNSTAFLFILVFQKLLIIKISEKNCGKKILLFLCVISLIIILLQIFGIINKFFNIPILFSISNALMIIIADFFKIITINLFIKLLPIENFKFLCCKSNNFINLSNKIIRLAPGILSIFIKNLPFELGTDDNNGDDENINLDKFSINLSINFLLFFINFMFLVGSDLKPNQHTRVLKV